MVGYSALCDAQSIDNPTLVALPVAAASAQTNTQVYRAFWQCRWPPDIEELREHGGMKDFSHFVLESTLELAVKAMPHDVRVGECVEAIRRFLKICDEGRYANCADQYKSNRRPVCVRWVSMNYSGLHPCGRAGMEGRAGFSSRRNGGTGGLGLETAAGDPEGTDRACGNRHAPQCHTTHKQNLHLTVL